MQKIKKSHLALIVTVLIVTIYNVFPTLLYYTKPLSKSVNQKQAFEIAKQSLDRVNRQQQDSLSWLAAYSKHLGISPKSINVCKDNSHVVEVCFHHSEHAKKFKTFMPRAGAMIPFAPAKLGLSAENNDNPTKVFVERKIGFEFSKNETSKLFSYIPKTEKNEFSHSYKNYLKERFAQLALQLAGESSNAHLLKIKKVSVQSSQILNAAYEINNFAETYGENSKIAQRYFMSFSQSHARISDAGSKLIEKFQALEKELQKRMDSLTNKDEEYGKFKQDKEEVAQAIALVKRQQKTFEGGQKPIFFSDVENDFDLSDTVFALENRNPYFESLEINWENGTVLMHLHPDVKEVFEALINTAEVRLKKEKLHQLLINEVAAIANKTHETINPLDKGYVAEFNQQENTTSYLALNLDQVAAMQIEKINQKFKAWSPQTPELSDDSFPLWNFETYKSLSEPEKKFGLLVYAPVIDTPTPRVGFDNGSIYVIARGLNPILQKYQQYSNLQQAESFKDEFIQFQNILRQLGFQFSYLGSESHEIDSEFQNDIIFECPSYYEPILTATREDFRVYGNKKKAVLELSNLEQRIITQNTIESSIHEDLLKWKESFQASQVDLHDPSSKFLIPPPSRNVFVNNFILSFKKYFRGDNRKVLKWGLDLIGGKSILIALKDHSNRLITDKVALNEGVNELTQRVNKMGLSEVDIRVQGTNIALDFPASKGLSAQELIKGSTMSFHIINEKFASKNSPYYSAMQKFLQEVWNEAVVTNRKDAESLNLIAYKQLGGQEETQEFLPRTAHAKELIAHGFLLAHPKKEFSTRDTSTQLSKIGIYRGEDFSEWRGQTHPLITMFNNYALEGADIENVRTNYDPSHGNTLTFGIKAASKDKALKNPREHLSHWTREYARDQVIGSVNEKYSMGRGWRMAIVLNGQVINDPQLNQPLHDNVQVSGGFTQNEATKLAADLKAGSLSFTPHIMSVDNVSADLGHAERAQGIAATAVALTLVVVLMIAYYRFSGLIASIAVLFNLLIMWAALQNLQATLTLSGIAGIILTVGMAVDANVLVFERIREELKKNQKLSTAIFTGYQKAFSAIFDSNITTIIAAIILLNFDAGPIKGLAITLTIGIASSMFTALFMTRAFFTGWLSKTKATTLKMANLFHIKAFDFLKNARPVAMISLFTIVVGSTLLFQQNKSIMGMDFTGGYSVSMTLDPTSAINYRKEVTEALNSAGAKSSEFQIRELNQPNALRIQLSSAMDEKGRPFEHFPVQQGSTLTANWQNNPRLSWVVEALSAKQIKLTKNSLSNLEKNWSEMSGQLSKTTRNNALIGLSLALLFILIYISLRYEISYALSAILCIIHDVLITVAFIAILHFCGVSIQINLQIIAAIMTIIGYSLNDTIIVFDRIREDKKRFRNKSFDFVINHSIQVTLNRTIMTSLTTFVVLLSLVTLGGSKIFDFSLVMSLGVILGTLSSIFIAPLLLQLIAIRDKKTKSVGKTQNSRMPA